MNKYETITFYRSRHSKGPFWSNVSADQYRRQSIFMLVLFHFLGGLLQRRQMTDSLFEFRLPLKQIGWVPCVSTNWETAPKSGSMTPRCGNPLADMAIETHLPSRPLSTWHQSEPADQREGPVRSVGWECRRSILHLLLDLSKNHFLLQCWCEILLISCVLLKLVKYWAGIALLSKLSAKPRFPAFFLDNGCKCNKRTVHQLERD